MLELRNVSYTVTDNGKKEILKNINLTIDDRFVVITGPNGSGKSTLAKIIAGIITPTSGQILLDGVDITEMSITERAKAGISFAFQQPVRFKGITALDASLPNGHFAVGRHIMTCCADDIAYRGVVAKGMGNLKIATRDWVIVEGKLTEEYSKLYKGNGPVLTVKSIEKATKPEQEVATFY